MWQFQTKKPATGGRYAADAFQEWYFLIAIAAAALLLAAFNGRPAFADGHEGAAAGIWVVGQGSASGAPDLAIVNLRVEVLADSAVEARTEAADGIDATIAALEESGVAEEDIQTRNYSIGPRYNYSKSHSALTMREKRS